MLFSRAMAYPPTLLADLAHSLLETGADALLAGGRDVPDRQYVSHSQPPAEIGDCAEALVSWIGPIKAVQKVPGTNGRGCATKTTVDLHLTLYRCWPTMYDDGTPPTADELNDRGYGLATDGLLLWFGVLSAWYDGSLFDVDGFAFKCEALDLSRGANPFPVSGGVTGWDIVGTLTL